MGVGTAKPSRRAVALMCVWGVFAGVGGRGSDDGMGWEVEEEMPTTSRGSSIR